MAKLKPNGEDTTVQTDVESGVVPTDTPAELKKPAREPWGGYATFVYVGPTLPTGELKTNAILQGSFNEVIKYYNVVIEKFPQIEKLIVPVHKLAEASQRANTPGNITNKYYSDIVSAMRT